MFCQQCGVNNNQESKFCVSCGNSLLLSNELLEGLENIVTPYAQKYAGFWFRTLAAVIDEVLVQVLGILLVWPFVFTLVLLMIHTSTKEEIEFAGRVLGFIVGFLVHWLWFTVAESSKWQGTLGKKMLGLKVVDDRGQRIGFGRANARYWSKYLSKLILFIGVVMVAFTKKKQGLHDKIAGTLVIKTND
jgi:uncharacterized RDD family membrane protein YckC